MISDYHLYKPALWFRNGHIQTIVSSLYRRVTHVKYQRERIQTPDNDFLDLDWVYSGTNSLAIISHGLEGHSHRDYVKGMVSVLTGIGISCLAWNYRGCSGEPNHQLRMYHNGSTDDLEVVIQHAVKKGYQSIILIGFSMGGNLSLLYLGQKGETVIPQIKCAVTFSVPLDLTTTAYKLAHKTNAIYMKYFLKTLCRKVKEKSQRFPGQIDISGIENIKTFKAFDDRYTAPIHGFDDAEDYWEKCSSGNYLEQIRVPGLIVNAKDDPFLTDSCYPENRLKNNNVVFEYPDYGGHVGFMINAINGAYWSEQRAIAFIQKLLKKEPNP